MTKSMKTNMDKDSYSDDVCVIPKKIKNMTTEEIMKQINLMQATQHQNPRTKSRIALPIHLEEKIHD